VTKNLSTKRLLLLAGAILLLGMAVLGWPMGSSPARLWLFGSGTFLLSLIVYRFALDRKQPEQGLLLLLPGLLFIRLLSLSSWLVKRVGAAPILEPLFQEPFSNSLWDLIWNASLIFFAAVYFHKRIQLGSNGYWSHTARFILSVGIYLSMGAGLVGIGLLFQSFSLHTDLPFNFDVIPLTGWPAIVATLSGLVLLLSLFLFTQRMMQALVQLEKRKWPRMAAMLIAILFIALLNYPFIPSTLPLGIQMLLIIIYLLISDLYIDYGNKSYAVTWGITWVTFLSIFAAAHLMGGSLEKDIRHRHDAALSLLQPRDTIAEQALLKVQSSVLDIDQSLAAHPYLLQHYDVKKRDTLPYSAVALTASLWLSDPGDYCSYIVKRTTDQGYLQFTPSKSPPDPILQATLEPPPFKGIEGINRLKFILFRAGQAISKNEDLNLTPPPLAAPGTVTNSRKQHLFILTVQGQDDVQAVVARKADLLLPMVSLSSFLFVILLILVILWSLEVRIGGWLSGALLPFGNWQSLQNRIQATFVGLFVLSFIVVGVIIVSFSRKSEIRSYQSQIAAEVGRVQLTLLDHLQKGKPLDQDLAQNMATTLDQGIIFFDANGQLTETSLLALQHADILPTTIPPAIKKKLQKGPKVTLHLDTIGQTTLQFAFVKLLQGEQVAGYFALLHLPPKNIAIRSYGFLSTLLNIYFFLLFITIAFAFFFARQLTQPISQLRERLGTFKLGKNEPIPWKQSNQDEIGELIHAYNQMVDQLEERTRQLKQNEREGAWREMAKQVAHEIKNPLTPMKLSIQHLKRAYQAQPDQVEPLLQRVSATLIEQIDGLARIASDFSNFAKMPKTKNSTFVLNEIVLSVSELFKTTDNLQLDIDLPDHPISVFADKEQLVRVMNNLIKNAIQAIPDDRKGHVRVKLQQNEGQALLSVQDNGSGIPEALQEKVFYPNFTTKSSGSGLGLAIAKNSIEAANGRMWLESEEGKGTTFFVELPIKINEY
jgi:two-component system nitrogen regulation sensor histidine kinase NtrY